MPVPCNMQYFTCIVAPSKNEHDDHRLRMFFTMRSNIWDGRCTKEKAVRNRSVTVQMLRPPLRIRLIDFSIEKLRYSAASLLNGFVNQRLVAISPKEFASELTN